MNPFFSIIIPLYNKERQIERTLQGVLSQNYEDFELIIINDGSTDKSLEIAQSFNDKRIKIFSQENKGAGAARNYGVDVAEADYIAFLDADDIWFNNHLSCLYEAIGSYPNNEWFSAAYSVKHSEKLTVKGRFNIDTSDKIMVVEDYFKSSIYHPLVMTSGVAFRKTVFLKMGGFNQAILSGQDLDLWFRYALQYNLVFNYTYTSVYDKTISNSLSKENHQKSKYLLFKSYDEQAKRNRSLKQYLTINKYSLAIQCKLSNNKKIYRDLKNEIDTSLLNKKQIFVLNQPVFLTRIFKKLYIFLVRNNIYLSAYS